MNLERWRDFPVGPKIRSWAGMEGRGGGGKDFTPAERAAFTADVNAFAAARPPASSEDFEDLMDELVAMDFPLPALALMDAHGPRFEAVMAFRGFFAASVAAMLVGEYSQASRYSFRAHELNPQEPAPYVNIAQILMQQGAWAEAQDWIDAGFRAELNNFNLWQLQGELFFHRDGSGFIDLLREKALDLQAWAGISLASAQAGGMRVEEKYRHFRQMRDAGEIGVDFLVEYTALLGELERFSEIPPLVWAAETEHRGEALPWQLHYHGACAHLGLGEISQARRCLNMLRFNASKPQGLDAEIERLEEECRSVEQSGG